MAENSEILNEQKDFVVIETDKGNIEIPLSQLEQVIEKYGDKIKVTLKERGEEIKLPLSEVKAQRMRLDEFSRKMAELREKEKEIEELLSVVRDLEGEETSSPSEVEEKGELSLTFDGLDGISDEEILSDPSKVFKRLAENQKKLVDYLKSLEREKKRLKEEIETQKATQKLAIELVPVIKKHKWLDPNSAEYDPIKAEVFVNRIVRDLDKSLLEIADEVEKHFSKYTTTSSTSSTSSASSEVQEVKEEQMEEIILKTPKIPSQSSEVKPGALGKERKSFKEILEEIIKSEAE